MDNNTTSDFIITYLAQTDLKYWNLMVTNLWRQFRRDLFWSLAVIFSQLHNKVSE